MTPCLQAGDIGIYCEFKDKISVLIDRWKQSDAVEYTRGGNPKPPAKETVHTWVSDAWKGVNLTNIQNSIAAAGFAADETKWHIFKHDVYGELFRSTWINTVDTEANIEDFEQIEQEDDVTEIDE